MPCFSIKLAAAGVYCTVHCEYCGSSKSDAPFLHTFPERQLPNNCLRAGLCQGTGAHPQVSVAVADPQRLRLSRYLSIGV